MKQYRSTIIRLLMARKMPTARRFISFRLFSVKHEMKTGAAQWKLHKIFTAQSLLSRRACARVRVHAGALSHAHGRERNPRMRKTIWLLGVQEIARRRCAWAAGTDHMHSRPICAIVPPLALSSFLPNCYFHVELYPARRRD